MLLLPKGPKASHSKCTSTMRLGEVSEEHGDGGGDDDDADGDENNEGDPKLPAPDGNGESGGSGGSGGAGGTRWVGGESGGGSGGAGGGPGGTREANDGRVRRKSITSTGLFQRSTTARFVGVAGQENRCEVVAALMVKAVLKIATSGNWL